MRHWKFSAALSTLLLFCFLNLRAGEERDLLSKKYSRDDLARILVEDKEWIKYPSYKNREEWHKIPEKIRKEYIERGERYLGHDWPQIKATEYLEFVRSGNREIMQNPYTKKRDAYQALVMAELMEGKGRFMDDIINGVWSFCEMTYWGLSAHLYIQEAGPGLPDVDDPSIDLVVGQIGTELAWTHHFFREEFDKVSPLINKRIIKEVNEKVLQPYYSTNETWWMGFNRDFVNNWNPWCNYNVLYCILLMEKDPEVKKDNVHKVLRSVDKFINYYHEDGGCDEGPSYWSHAGGKLFDVLELLH